MREAMLYEPMAENKVRCNLCNHHCKIQEGKSGICGVRQNLGGKLYSLVYGKIVAEHIDPIEKKPLFNFLPGSKAFSIGTVGCNFRCRYCQNYDISQYPHEHEGEIIGQHQGLMYYTLGQRQGLGIGGRQDAAEAPWYVVGKDLEENRLIAAQGHDHPMLLCHSLQAGQIHWIAGEAPTLPLICEARIRHRQPLQACRIEPQQNGQCQVVFEQAQRAVTPGQAIVFYQDRECLGGGTIESAQSQGLLT